MEDFLLPLKDVWESSFSKVTWEAKASRLSFLKLKKVEAQKTLKFKKMNFSVHNFLFIFIEFEFILF